MAFNSLNFVAFFALVVLLYFTLLSKRQWQLLFVASCYFYMVWRPEYIVLILGESYATYWTGLAIARETLPARRRAVVGTAIVGLLSVLFIFKYVDFVNASIRTALGWIGATWPVPDAGLVLPLGISFHTFILIGYLLDVYRGKMLAEHDAGVFGVFSVFFPLLVAGPIERAEQLLPQFKREHRWSGARVDNGLRLMAWGFFKKIVVADRIGPFVDQVYADPHGYDGHTLVLSTVAFAFQIYCDFSAYSDIARGAARVLGIELTKNFNQPYFATSISEFWKRWHISLSTWLTDYVYSAFTRASWLRLRWYPKFLVSLMLTFLVSGVWHGAAWTYVVWGALHGTYLVGSIVTQNLRRRLVGAIALDRFPMLLHAFRVGVTFSMVCLSYVFFRAESVSDGWHIVTHLLSPAPDVGDQTPSVLQLALGAMLVVVVLTVEASSRDQDYGQWWSVRTAWQRWTLDYALVSAMLLLSVVNATGSFIYFQF